MVVEVPADPSALLPPAGDDTTALLVDLLYDPLYRLDAHLEPQPALAAGLPTVDAQGTTWTIGLRPGARFADGSTISASDVAFSLGLVASTNCPFDRDLCDAAAANIASVTAPDPATVVVTLRQPFGPFLAEVLAGAPIVSESAVQAGTQALMAGAAAIPADAPGKQVATIADATSAAACVADSPPVGCRFADYTAAMEQTLRSASITVPSRERFTGATGELDAEAYAGALFARVEELDRLLTGTGNDQLAAALPLLDLTKHPIGGGPYRLDAYLPGESIELVANPGHAGGAPGIGRIRLEIVGDPAIAATRLMTGDADWVLDVTSDQLDALQGAAGLQLGGRPLDAQRTIVFNVRPGHVYADPVARTAFAQCLDRTALARAASGGTAVVATGPFPSGSWAAPVPTPAVRDPAAAIRALTADGWARGSDGIFTRSGQRLSSSVAVRPSRTDLLAFAQAAAGQLAECGIELQVQQLDLTGDVLLSQLQWPNQFDTVLLLRNLAADPDPDVQPFESGHATSATDQADANPGGYASAEADALIAAARASADQAERTRLYGQLSRVLEEDMPAWPIWYDTGWSAISKRVGGPSGPIDPSVPRYFWNVGSWTLAPIGK